MQVLIVPKLTVVSYNEMAEELTVAFRGTFHQLKLTKGQSNDTPSLFMEVYVDSQIRGDA